MEPTLKELLAKYSGKVKLAYRDFPIREIHAHAELAAEASRCAAEQGKFWEYHDSLFSSQEELDREDLLRKADAATADRHRLTDCLNQGKYIQQVDHDVQDPAHHLARDPEKSDHRQSDQALIAQPAPVQGAHPLKG